ncbi:MAG: response regulator [Nevskia sp.]|nr:response regulator [Nevskia sp.]
MIHIVDDDEPVRTALSLLLRSFGWQASAFGSARAFLESLRQGDMPDCLLLDLNMPGMNGAELMEALASMRVWVPVIIMTGQRDSPLEARARRAGAREVLNKPFGDEELKASIERALANAGGG